MNEKFLFQLTVEDFKKLLSEQNRQHRQPTSETRKKSCLRLPRVLQSC